MKEILQKPTRGQVLPVSTLLHHTNSVSWIVGFILSLFTRQSNKTAIAGDTNAYPNQMSVLNAYECKKCKNAKYDLGETREVSGLLSKILNLQTRKFQTVTCTRCGYTEHFERRQSPLSNVMDLFIR
ncbi:hypothetical protein AKO1_001466 [Acrasis kona]